ncbi:MAG: segregation/condensation protein A [Patescibacteria group bacterium]
MNNYELKIEQFSGPIEKLLELIEGKKMEITELNLAEVTADFLNYLKQVEKIEPRLLADFVVVAAKLLLIKSKALLPNLRLSDDEEEDIKDFENRLKNYQQFKPAINYLKNLSEQNKFLISRPLFAGRPTIFYPSKNLEINELYKMIKGIFETFNQLQNETKIIKPSLITLEEKIEEIMERLNTDLHGFTSTSNFSDGASADSRGQVNFNDLTNKKIRSEIVVLFLALLHLLARQSIKIEQKKGFSDIIINKN